MRTVGLAVLCACSFEHGELPGSGSGDGGVDPDGNLVDRDAPPTCTFGAWSAPQPVTELNGGSLDAMPRFTADERIVVIHSIRAGGTGQRDVWLATRTSATAAFSAPVELAQLNTTGQDRDPAISADGLYLVFASTAAGGEHDIYYTSRDDTTRPFGPPQPLEAANTTGRDYFTSLSADGRTLCFSSDRSGGAGNYDLWYLTRASTAAAFTGTPQNFGGLNSAENEFGLVISADGLEAYVSSGPFGNPDIRRATRATTADTFSTPVAVSELNSSTEDHPGWLSPDGTRFYFASDRSGEFQIYLSTRGCI